MKATTKDHEQRRAEIMRQLEEAEAEVSQEIDVFNNALSGHAEDLKAAIDAYNGVVADAKALADEVNSDIMLYVDDRSEKWQEDDKGQAYAAWAESFESLNLSEIEVSIPDAIEEPEFDARPELEQSWESEPNV